jgi:hypothetical protein
METIEAPQENVTFAPPVMPLGRKHLLRTLADASNRVVFADAKASAKRAAEGAEGVNDG